MRPGRKHGTKKFLGVIMAVGVMAASTYAFTATNTVGASKAGDGANAISGYTVSAVTYTQNAVDPTLLDNVKFTLSSSAKTVKAQLSTTTLKDTWYTCTDDDLAVGPLNNWTCATPSYAVADATNLRVVATE